MKTSPRLILLEGPHDAPPRVNLPDGESTLGRLASNSIPILWDDKVSRRHARIFKQAGLFWLEDLGSSNGTFLSMPGSPERKLAQGENVLLLDGVTIRLGLHTRFRVEGVAGTQNEALGLLLNQLQQVLANVYTNLSGAPASENNIQRVWLNDFESRLRAARDEQELMLIAAEGTQALYGTVHAYLPPENKPELPPLPDDLPAPDASNRLNSLRNFFISDIHKYFPEEDKPNDSDH